MSEPVRYGSLTEEMRPKLYHLLGRSGGGVSGGRSWSVTTVVRGAS